MMPLSFLLQESPGALYRAEGSREKEQPGQLGPFLAISSCGLTGQQEEESVERAGIEHSGHLLDSGVLGLALPCHCPHFEGKEGHKGDSPAEAPR
jgi:hypothetical protein